MIDKARLQALERLFQSGQVSEAMAKGGEGKGRSRKGRVVDAEGNDHGEMTVKDIRTRWKPKSGIVLFGTAKINGKNVKVRWVAGGRGGGHWKEAKISARPPKGWQEKPAG